MWHTPFKTRSIWFNKSSIQSFFLGISLHPHCLKSCRTMNLTLHFFFFSFSFPFVYFPPWQCGVSDTYIPLKKRSVVIWGTLFHCVLHKVHSSSIDLHICYLYKYIPWKKRSVVIWGTLFSCVLHKVHSSSIDLLYAILILYLSFKYISLKKNSYMLFGYYIFHINIFKLRKRLAV